MTPRRAKKLLRNIQQDRIYDEDIAKNIVKRDTKLDRYINQKGYTDKAKKKEAKIVKDMQTSVSDAKMLKSVIDDTLKKIGDNQLSVYQSNDATRLYNKSRRTSVALGDAAVSGALTAIGSAVLPVTVFVGYRSRTAGRDYKVYKNEDNPSKRVKKRYTKIN